MGGAKKSLEGCKPGKNGLCDIHPTWNEGERVPDCWRDWVSWKHWAERADAVMQGHYEELAKNGGDPADLNTISQVTPPDWAALRWLMAKALANGASRESLMTTRWDISGDCENSYELELWARPLKFNGDKWAYYRPGKRAPLRLFLHTRCRKCKCCLRARARLWRLRAMWELPEAQRTWFGTFTLSPAAHFKVAMKCREITRKSGRTFEELPTAEQFKLRHKLISREFTLMFKRLRKNNKGVRFKYLLVAEAHKSGLPHYHALFHEKRGSAPLRYRALKREWRMGFTSFKLASGSDNPTYLCKYLAKDMLARVRASIRYGEGTSLDDLMSIGYDIAVNTPDPKTFSPPSGEMSGPGTRQRGTPFGGVGSGTHGGNISLKF